MPRPMLFGAVKGFFSDSPAKIQYSPLSTQRKFSANFLQLDCLDRKAVMKSDISANLIAQINSDIHAVQLILGPQLGEQTTSRPTQEYWFMTPGVDARPYIYRGLIALWKKNPELILPANRWALVFSGSEAQHVADALIYLADQAPDLIPFARDSLVAAKSDALSAARALLIFWMVNPSVVSNLCPTLLNKCTNISGIADALEKLYSYNPELVNLNALKQLQAAGENTAACAQEIIRARTLQAIQLQPSATTDVTTFCSNSPKDSNQTSDSCYTGIDGIIARLMRSEPKSPAFPDVTNPASESPKNASHHDASSPSPAALPYDELHFRKQRIMSTKQTLISSSPRATIRSASSFDALSPQGATVTKVSASSVMMKSR